MMIDEMPKGKEKKIGRSTRGAKEEEDEGRRRTNL
jgi:hypothetical protein